MSPEPTPAAGGTYWYASAKYLVQDIGQCWPWCASSRLVVAGTLGDCLIPVTIRRCFRWGHFLSNASLYVHARWYARRTVPRPESPA